MKYCHDYAALLDLYVDGELTAEELTRVHAHLDTCPGCRAYVDDALAIRAAFPDAEDTILPDDFTARVMEGVRKAPRRRSGAAPWRKVLTPLAACFAIVLVLQYLPLDRAASKSEAAQYFAADVADEESGGVSPYADEKAALEAAENQAAAPMEAAGKSAEKTIAEDTPESEPQRAMLLPPEAAALMAEYPPAEETEAEIHYLLSPADWQQLSLRLEESGIPYTAEYPASPDEHSILVILAR